MMNCTFYKTSAIVELRSGLVELSADQQRRRAPMIKKTSHAGVFEIVKPIQFKAGEQFGIAGELPKALLKQVTTVEKKPVLGIKK